MTVVVTGRVDTAVVVLVMVCLWGPEVTNTATTMPNPSASPAAMTRPMVVARPGRRRGESSTPLRLRPRSNDLSPQGDGCATRQARETPPNGLNTALVPQEPIQAIDSSGAMCVSATVSTAVAVGFC